MAENVDTDIRIERAGPRDFLAVAALDRVAWRRNRHAEFIPDGEHAWRVWCEHALTFVARRGDTVVGAIMAFPCVDGRWFVHKVMVDQSQRGRGIGSKLFEALLAEIDRRGGEASLTVDPANDSALKLYAKWGFTQRQFVEGFYRDHEDRYVLTRPARGTGGPGADNAD